MERCKVARRDGETTIPKPDGDAIETRVSASTQIQETNAKKRKAYCGALLFCSITVIYIRKVDSIYLGDSRS